MSIGDAFRECVLKDEELIRTVHGSEVHRRYKDVLDEGCFPGPFIIYRWPVSLPKSGLAYEFVHLPFIIEGSPDPKPTAQIIQAADILEKRWKGLMRLLADGELVARGMFAQTGIVQDVPPLMWRREATFVDVRNSDILEKVQNDYSTRWSGVSLHVRKVSRSARNLIGAESGSKRASRKKSPGHESVLACIQALWPEGIPAGLSVKARNARINDWQRENGLAVVSSKTIERALRSS